MHHKMKQQLPAVKHMQAQLWLFICLLLTLGLIFSCLSLLFFWLFSVITLFFYKWASIICTSFVGVILKPSLCEPAFNLSYGPQNHSTVSLTTFPTLDKLPISLGFRISALRSCGVYVCLGACLPHLVCVFLMFFVHRRICVCRTYCFKYHACVCLCWALGWPCVWVKIVVPGGEGRQAMPILCLQGHFTWSDKSIIIPFKAS